MSDGLNAFGLDEALTGESWGSLKRGGPPKTRRSLIRKLFAPKGPLRRSDGYREIVDAEATPRCVPARGSASAGWNLT